MSDSYNHLFKQSVNSLNRNLISGGSSGGEGALIGCHGSIVGVGTDIGGSIRIPANLQGLYGLSPTVGRFPWHASVIRDNIVNGVAGPLSCTIDTQEVFWKSLLDAEPWNYEPTSYSIPWRSHLAAKPSRKLKIGYYVDDGMVKVQPPIERAVHEVIEKLKAAGHEVVQWDISSHREGQRLWLKAVLADGGRRFRKLCEQSDEPLVEGMLVGTEEDRLDVDEANQVSNDRLAYQKSYMRRWMDSGIDALIMPVQPWVGFPPKTWVQSSQNVSYTSHWNLVDFAALAIPVTTARLDDIGTDAWKQHKPRDVSDDFNWEQYDPELVKGMPVGVQIVGGRFGEERCLAVAKVVEEALQH
jgi:amidase